MSDFEVPDGIVGSEHLGVRVFCVAAPDPQQLADQIALVLGEHLAADDEMHITYNALETGWQHDPGRAGWLGREPHTQLLVEYTVLLVLRASASQSGAMKLRHSGSPARSTAASSHLNPTRPAFPPIGEIQGSSDRPMTSASSLR
jgi:hypothetical protein